jgi:arylformamidase
MTDIHPLNAAATVADIDAIFRDYASTSERARAQFAIERNLAYGPTALETLDFFAAAPGAPLVVFIHGGYWRRMDKDDVSFVAAGLVPLGISVATLNYGLAPQVPLAAIVAQCRSAVAWLRANAAALGFDPDRLSVAGHSAGGHLAAMCAVDAPAHALVTLSGLHDLVPVQRSFVNEWLNIDEAAARSSQPRVNANPPRSRRKAKRLSRAGRRSAAAPSMPTPRATTTSAFAAGSPIRPIRSRSDSRRSRINTLG